jgi:hypothetical protein
MKPNKNKKRIDPRYFLDETYEHMSDEEWMYGRFENTPGYEEEAVPGLTAAKAQSATNAPPPERGGHSADHPMADVYDQQMADLDAYQMEESEDLSEAEGGIVTALSTTLKTITKDGGQRLKAFDLTIKYLDSLAKFNPENSSQLSAFRDMLAKAIRAA